MGPRAELRDDRALHDRRGLRGRRRDPPQGLGRPARRARRSAAPGRVPRADGSRGGPLRVRRRRATRSATSSCAAIRTCSATRCRDRAGADRRVGAAEGRRARRARRHERNGGVPLALPALLRARKLLSRAVRAGFERADPKRVAEQLAAFESGDAEMLGDLLLSIASLAERACIEPETALRDAAVRFEQRVRGARVRAQEVGRSNWIQIRST